MATPAQINANRANALKSTGPRSAEGKSASRFNALKHGIDAASIVIPGEDPADYDALVAAYHRDFRPESPSETFHVDTMLRADWQKRRLQRVEADLHRTLLAETPGASLAAALLSDSPAAKLLARVQRQIAAFERTWYRANTELRRARRQAEADTDQALDRYIDSLGAPSRPELASFPQSANTSHPAPTHPQFQPATGPQPTKKPAVLCTSWAEKAAIVLSATALVISNTLRQPNYHWINPTHVYLFLRT